MLSSKTASISWITISNEERIGKAESEHNINHLLDTKFGIRECNIIRIDRTFDRDEEQVDSNDLANHDRIDELY